jgi:hypothetical protein
MATAETRLSGTYVAHDARSAAMLQLTQTDNGQITGVVSIVEINSEGKIDSRQRSVNGALDNGQIMLSFSSGLNTTALAGTVNGNSIALQHVDPQGGVDSLVFARASAAQFKTYADEMKAKGRARAHAEVPRNQRGLPTD